MNFSGMWDFCSFRCLMSFLILEIFKDQCYAMVKSKNMISIGKVSTITSAKQYGFPLLHKYICTSW